VGEAEAGYVQAMKFCFVLNRHIQSFSTREAWIEEGSHFQPVLKYFLPRSIPWFGLVEHETAEKSVGEIRMEMDAYPTLAKSIWAITCLVWRRFMDEIQQHQIFDTKRGGGDMQRVKTKSRNDVDAPDPNLRLFQLSEFISHMEEHLERIIGWLKRTWRDYVIAEVTDKLAAKHNFFMDDLQMYLKSPLHRVLCKLDIILSSQMRWFVEGSFTEWACFMESFLPSPSRPLPAPLLVISIVALGGQVTLTPAPEELTESLTKLLEKITDVTEAISTCEHEEVPFCNLTMYRLFEPFADPDGGRKAYQPLEDAKRVTEKVIRQCLEGPQEVLSRFQQYDYLLSEAAEGLDPMNVETTHEKVARYLQVGREVELLSATILDFPLFQLQCHQIIEVLSLKAYSLAAECLGTTTDCIKQRAKDIGEEWERTYGRMCSTPKDEEELAELKEFMAVVDKKVSKPLVSKTREVHRQIDMVESFFYEVEPDVVLSAFHSFEWPMQITMAVADAERNLDREKVQFMEQLDKEKVEFWNTLAKQKDELQWVMTLGDYKEALKVASRIDQLHQSLERSVEKVQSFTDRERLFQIAETDYTELDMVSEEFKPFHKLWEAAIEYKGKEEEWMTGSLVKLNASEIEEFVDDQFKDAFKMIKSFEGSDNPQGVAKAFREDIIAFKKNMPIISSLCQEAIEPRHFAELFDAMDADDVDIESELTLQTLLSEGVLNHISTVEEISTQAQKQYGLKQTMKQMKSEWKTLEFDSMPYKETGTSLIKGTDEVQAQLDDHIIKVQAVRGSPFVKPIEKEVKDWEAKLIYIQDLLEQWLMFQRTWLYLEPIFGAEDIVRQMPNEAKIFRVVDTLWRNTMNSVIESPNAIDVSDIDGLLVAMIDANKKLDAIQKSLNDYLETKRLAFPRFFFLSNDELLMILSQTKDPTAVQPHMGKCFEGINSVRFDEKNEIIEAMLSIEGEVVELFSP
jgi:dynein heavy chain